MLRWLIAAALVCSACSSAASPWLEPGDPVVRSDLETLVDAGVITTPITTWPLAWNDIAAAITAARASGDIDARAEPALQRMIELSRLETRTDELAMQAGLVVAERPQRIRTFSDTPRADAEARFGLAWTGNRLAFRLVARAVSNPVDGDTVRLDGSYIGFALGNWMFSAGFRERWWGPGWDGSLILSTNARPTPQLAISRNRATPPELRWLRWVGPWSVTSFMGRLDDERAIHGALLFGLRATAKPLPSLEVGISRTAQWCGSTRPCDSKAFFNLLVGHDNVGHNISAADQPGNQLAGIDVRWKTPSRLPMAVYAQWIAEDSRKGGPELGSWLRQVGIELSGNAFGSRWQHRSHFEVADTTCREGGAGSGNVKPNCAYDHSLYRTGYRYLGQSLAHGMDGDSIGYTVGSTLTSDDGRSWELSARQMEINRVGAPDPAHSLSATPQSIRELSVSHTRSLKIGALDAGLGYTQVRDSAAGALPRRDWFGWVGFRIN